MSFSCITAKHSQKGSLNKSRMSVETFPGGTAHYHHHFGTGPHSSNSGILKDGDVLIHSLKPPSALALPKWGRGVFCLLPKGKVRSFCTSWIGIKEPTKSRLPVRQRGAVITAKREKERDETETKALVF